MMVGCGGGVGVDHETFLAVEPVFTGSELAAYLADQGEPDRPCAS